MSKTIALVDDDRNILTSISMALEREGYKVQTYIDGQSALVGLTRNPPVNRCPVRFWSARHKKMRPAWRIKV